MPSATTSPSSPPAASKGALHKQRLGQQPQKKRVVRRRGRAPAGIESDDEIEREMASDSDYDNDDHDRSSSLDSATDDSDTEPASEDAPSNSESPPATTVVGVAGETNGGVAPFFASTSNWSDMVTDEVAHGPSGLPVIDFAEFDGAVKIPARRAKKAQKQRKQQVPVTVMEAPTQQSEPPSEANAAPTPSVPASLHRKLGQTARQAYQQRLESDPSYVPKVGGFWGHDDRLMDKDLRSLSGWWRGKWSGRARGRGFGRRGGAHGEHGQHEASLEELPPVERTWTHDGFEEMKRKEEQRHWENEGGRGRGGFRGGRGGFAGRGRGSFGRWFGSPASSGRALSPVPRPNRVWFAQKPELTWSKQSEAFLFYENGFKSTTSHKHAIRVKLPGKAIQIAKVTQPLEAKEPVPVSHPSENSPERKELQYTVRLPNPKLQQSPDVQPPPQEPVASPSVESASLAEERVEPPAHPAPVKESVPIQTLPDPSIASQLEQLSIEPKPSDPERQAKTEEAVLRNVTQDNHQQNEVMEAASLGELRPALPPLQTVFTPPPPPPPPVAQPSPVYGSPYAFPQALPPGIALNHQGMPFEVATGRPVYLQPPPPMYNPQPMHYPPPAVPYMHGHMHRPSAMSPDYLAQVPSHTPPMNGFVDPSTGAPLFSLPRSSVRVEIRAPDDARPSGSSSSSSSSQSAKSPSHNRTQSKLRTTATSFEPARPNGAEYYPSIGTPSEGSTHPPSYETTNGYENGGHPTPPMGGMMGYPGYPQPYYYPEPYGYSGYMDMSQVGQFDMYHNMDQSQQGAVYY